MEPYQSQQPYSPPVAGTTAAPTAEHNRNKWSDYWNGTLKGDGAFAIGRPDYVVLALCLAIGFLFVRWILWPAQLLQGWGVSAVTIAFAATGLGYALVSKMKPSLESWFWLTILLLTGASYALWPAGSMTLAPFAAMLLFGSAFYWSGNLFGVLMQGKTSNFLVLDILNLTVLIPIRNALLVVPVIGSLFHNKGKKSISKKVLLPILLGLAVCVPLLVIILPALLRADSGNFTSMTEGLVNIWKRFMAQNIFIIIIQLVLAVPLCIYLFALLAGMAHQRRTQDLNANDVRAGLNKCKIVPEVTIIVVLAVVCSIYLLFIGCQIPYFFSAFSGKLPAQYTAYDQYAREGFFELCWIATLNLTLMGLANWFNRRPTRESKPLQVLNILLCLLTILVIGTAFSKMALYIHTYGYTPKRIMTCVFMLFLACVCFAVMVLQFKQFSVVRFAAIVGSVMLCALCLCNLDGLVAHWNANRYLEGKLKRFDLELLEQGGPAGYADGYRVLEADQTQQQGAPRRLKLILRDFEAQAEETQHSSMDSVVNMQVRKQSNGKSN